MLTIPFNCTVWNGITYSKPYYLYGLHEMNPLPSDYTTVHYAKYSKKYWEGVRQRQHKYRLLKKIEHQDWLKHG